MLNAENTFDLLLTLGFCDADARRLAVKLDSAQALSNTRETVALCKAAVSASGRAVHAQWGGTAHGLALAFIDRDTPVATVRKTLADSLTTAQHVDVWAARAAQIEAAR